jgi:DNA polymerase I-like protein with 3'-5' exonuclease and polymerase domains
MGVTESGKIATNKQALAAGVTDKQLAAVLQYRAQLHTSVDTSLTTWLGMAEASGGFIYSNWNQVKGEGRGARTGRLSSSPNFQNIPKSWKPLFSHEKKGLPQAPFRNLPPLPLCRSYIIPYRDDHVLIGRDFSQHELRILAHFGDGELLARYRADQWIDMHDTVKDDLLRLAGREITRDTAKTLNFSLLYGMGIGEMARRLILTVDDAKMLKKAVLDLYPELEDLYKTTRALARSDEPIVTWGGREAFCEVPTKDKTGKFIDWSYKLPNYLIQGSASDAAKEAIIRYADAAPKEHFLLLTVHDEILASVPRCDIVCGHDTMRSCMESLEFDVPNLTEGKFSATNWAALTPYDKRGVTLV